MELLPAAVINLQMLQIQYIHRIYQPIPGPGTETASDAETAIQVSPLLRSLHPEHTFFPACSCTHLKDVKQVARATIHDLDHTI